MSKSLEKISPKSFFNIKYIIISDNESQFVNILEKLLHLPWDVREIFKNSKKILEKCNEHGLIYPNYIIIESQNTQKILEEYNNHMFVFVVHIDGINFDSVVNDYRDFYLRNLNISVENSMRISKSDIFNISQINDVNMVNWIFLKTNHFGKFYFKKYFKNEYNEEGFSKIIDNLSPRVQEFLDMITWLTDEFGKSELGYYYLDKKIDFDKIVNDKIFFEIGSNDSDYGVLVKILEDDFFYYGKYSRKLIQNGIINKERKVLAITKINKIHDIDEIKKQIIIPLVYTKLNKYLFYTLDYDINRIRQEVNLIASHCRLDNSSSKSAIKKYYKSLSHLIKILNLSINDYSEIKKLKNHLSTKDSYYNFKLNSTLPLGWVDVDGCPLSLKFMYSIMPNNKEKIINTRKLIIKKEKPFDVLIIRSFDDDDQLKFLMEKSLKISAASKKEMKTGNEQLDANYKFVDLESEEHLISTLNNSTENIIIFDCHGTKVDDDGNYGLYLYGQKVNLGNLKDRITRIPPIVIFSCCDSFPLNANQNSSPAQLSIDLGARVVVGTYLPIDGRLASLAIARLLHRLQHYIDIVIKDKGKVDFSNIFQGWFIMMYTSEVLDYMVLDKVITRDEKYKLQLPINCIINPMNRDWFNSFIEILKNNINVFKSRENVINYLRENVALTDSMKYVCVGYPENVYIVKDDKVFDPDLFDIIN